MTSTHREELLLKLLAGEIDPQGEEGRRLLENDPLLKKEFAEVQALPDELDSLAAEEAAAVAAVAKELPASAAVDKALAQLRNQRPRNQRPRNQRPGSFSRFFPSLLAAAAVVAIGITIWMVLDEEEKSPIQVLGGDFNVVQTTEPVDRYAFSWDAYPLSRGEKYYLYIDAGQGATKEVWRGTDTSWTPTEEAAAELPDEISWWVEVMGLDADYPTATSTKAVSKRK